MNYGLALAALLLLTGCQQQETARLPLTTTFDDELVQVIAALDPATFATLVYNEDGDSYIILQAPPLTTVSWQQVGQEAHIYISSSSPNEPTIQAVYTLTLPTTIRAIRMYENDVEIPFNSWQ